MILNMFRASLCSSSGGQLHIYGIWYRQTLYAAIQSVTLQYLVSLVINSSLHYDARSENH
jgi:hypothetical protein